jgi:predicted dinucleotide-binding enzyme
VKSDVLVVGDDREARRITADLIGKIAGARTIDAGPLENARYAEHLAALLISLNLRHEVDSSGVRFTGLPGLEDDG